jgi:hypothetical protein
MGKPHELSVSTFNYFLAYFSHTNPSAIFAEVTEVGVPSTYDVEYSFTVGDLVLRFEACTVDQATYRQMSNRLGECTANLGIPLHRGRATVVDISNLLDEGALAQKKDTLVAGRTRVETFETNDGRSLLLYTNPDKGRNT